MRRHFIFVPNQITFDKPYTAHLIDTKICLKIETCQPRPGRSLMISIITLDLRTDIIRIIPTALRAQGTESFRSKQLFRHNIEYTFFLAGIQRRIIKCHGKYHIRTHTPLHHVTIDIIEQIAIFIQEHIDKRLPAFLGQSSQ